MRNAGGPGTRDRTLSGRSVYGDLLALADEPRVEAAGAGDEAERTSSIVSPSMTTDGTSAPRIRPHRAAAVSNAACFASVSRR